MKIDAVLALVASVLGSREVPVVQGPIKAVALVASVVSLWLCGCMARSSDQPVSNLQREASDQQIVASDATGSVVAAGAAEAQEKTTAPIGTLKGREYAITIYSTTDGPRFTIAGADGRVLGEKLSADEIRAQHPTIYETYKSTFAGTGGSFDASVGHVIDAR